MKIAFMEGTSITLLKMTVIKEFNLSLGAFNLFDFSRSNWIMYYKGAFTFGSDYNKSNVKDILSMCITILVIHSKKKITEHTEQMGAGQRGKAPTLNAHQRNLFLPHHETLVHITFAYYVNVCKWYCSIDICLCTLIYLFPCNFMALHFELICPSFYYKLFCVMINPIVLDL